MNAVERAHIDKKARLVSRKKTPDEKIFAVLSEVFSAQCVLWMHATVFTRKRKEGGETEEAKRTFYCSLFFASRLRLAEQETVPIFQRVAFNVLVSNVDDHLRNHGFLRIDSPGSRSGRFEGGGAHDEHRS